MTRLEFAINDSPEETDKIHFSFRLASRGYSRPTKIPQQRYRTNQTTYTVALGVGRGNRVKHKTIHKVEQINLGLYFKINLANLPFPYGFQERLLHSF